MATAAAAASGAKSYIQTTLASLSKTVDGLIETEIGQPTPTDSYIVNANYVQMAIDNAKYAWSYDGTLTQDLTKLDKRSRALINYQIEDLTNMVEALKSKDTNRMLDLRARVDSFIREKLDTPDWVPRLTGYSPHEVTKDSQISFTGTFRYAAANAGNGGCYVSISGGECTQRPPLKKTPGQEDKLVVQIQSLPPATNKYIRVSFDPRYKGWLGKIYSHWYTIWLRIQRSSSAQQ